MRRVAITGLMYLVLMNGTAVALEQTGFFDELGVSVNLTATSRLDDAVESMYEMDLDGGFLDTLVKLFSSVVDVVEVAVAGLYAGPEMVMQLGLPSEIVGPFIPVIVIIFGLAVIYYASGRD